MVIATRGMGGSEREVARGVLQGEIDGVPVSVELATKATNAPEEFASLPLDGRLPGDEALLITERGMLGEQSEAQREQSVVGKVDDDDLGGGDKSVEAGSLHRFFPATALGFVDWAKTSRKSFSSRRGRSRSAATESSSSARFMRTR